MSGPQPRSIVVPPEAAGRSDEDRPSGGPSADDRRLAMRGLVGRSGAIRDLNQIIARVAGTNDPVLLVGETGTGKETIARAIHFRSDRRDERFVAVSCAARSSEELRESELFGHVRGAFPGALRPYKGLFVEADGGTLFLDEVGNMPLLLQERLVRVLQLGEIRPLGGASSRAINVRCIASTQVDLGALIKIGAFRPDLFRCLNAIPVRVPPLRERREDIALLVEHFFARAQARPRHGGAWSVSEDGLRALEGYAWPGNVTELHNMVERLVTTGASSSVDVSAVRAMLAPPQLGDSIEALVRASLPLDELKARYTAAVLQLTEGNKPKAAAILGIDLSTLYRHAKRARV
jgi:two-component system response regulator HydG